MNLTCNDITKTFKKSIFKLDIKKFDLTDSLITGILGPNGSGKTTFLKIIVGLIKNDAGLINLDQYQHIGKAFKSKFGYLPENFSFPSNLKVKEVLKLYHDLAKVDSINNDFNLDAILSKWNISYPEKKMSELSKGMYQTIGLAHVTSIKRNIYILDEPFNGLDAVQKRTAINIIKSKKETFNASFIFTSHILSDVDKFCDRVYLIKEGKFIDNISMKNILEKYESTEDYYLNTFTK